MPVFRAPLGPDIAFDKVGAGPPVLLLHGFPQTRAMWHAIAPRLATDFTVVTADLRGYGASHAPQTPEEMAFAPMAADQVALMRHLGFDSFHVVGHDRGGRTAHRMALDTPEVLRSLTVMDIVPTHHLLANVTQAVATAYYHWFFLAQPAPLPERMIGADPDAFFESCLAGWGGGMAGFAPAALEAYRAAWRRPEIIASMCNDYRAGIEIDFENDASDLGRTVDVPSLVLYGADGVMAAQYDVPATWADRLSNMQSAPVPGGHFFPDTHPTETARALSTFLRAQP